MKPFAAQSELSCFQPPTCGKNFDNNTQHVISSQPGNHDGDDGDHDGDDGDYDDDDCDHDGDDGDHDGDEGDYKDTVCGWSDFYVLCESTGHVS